VASRARGTLPFDVADRRLAAAAWGRLTEPGDPAAGVLRHHLGDSEALDWLLHLEAREAIGGLPAPLADVASARAVQWPRAVARWLPRLATLDIRRELEVLHRLGGRLVIPEDEHWPQQLDDLGITAPAALWVRGELTTGPGIALVGARAATSYGEHLAARFAHDLAEEGFVVISGGAYGIDAAAHRGALAAGGRTWALLAGGVDRLYPAGNSSLLSSIIDSGAVISEAPCGTAPMRSRFLQRNRLIAALAEATVVVEAAWRSGAINTASHAGELLRPLGAVPGPVTSMASAGCHRLLRENNAVCVTDVAEIRELVPGGAPAPQQHELDPGLLDGLDPLARQVLDALPARSSAAVPSLVRSSGLSSIEVRAALGRLELAGRAARDGAGWCRLRD